MRLRINRFIVLSCLLLALNAVGLLAIRHELLKQDADKTDSSRVTVALTTRDVDRAERLTFAFNQPIVEAKKPDEPVVVSPLLLQPQPLGYWQWVSPSRLDYVLAQPLLAGRTIRVVPVAGFGEESGQVVQATGKLEIQTRRLVVANCRFQSADREAVTIEFVFNQKVEPGELLRHLVLTDPAVKARNEKGYLLQIGWQLSLGNFL